MKRKVDLTAMDLRKNRNQGITPIAGDTRKVGNRVHHQSDQAMGSSPITAILKRGWMYGLSTEHYL